MSGSTSRTLRGAALRYAGSPQPYRGKLTIARLRALRILHREYPEPVRLDRRGVQPRTIRALRSRGVIAQVVPGGFTLTSVGLVAMVRYTPRRQRTA